MKKIKFIGEFLKNIKSINLDFMKELLLPSLLALSIFLVSWIVWGEYPSVLGGILLSICCIISLGVIFYYQTLINKRLIKNSEIILLIVVVVLCSVYAHIATNGDEKISLAIIALSVPLALGLEKQRLENDKIERELLNSYHKAFQKHYLKDVHYMANRTALSDPLSKEDFEKFIKVIGYISLCGETYGRYKKGRVSKESWDYISPGMTRLLSSNKKLLKLISDTSLSQSHEGLFIELGLDFV